MEKIKFYKSKKAQWLYIIQAGLEYLVSLLVTGSFLATLTKEIGISDSVTGILSSIVSLGCLFQLISIVYRKTKVKKMVVVMSITNQLLFAFLYVIPFVGGSKNIKTVLFMVTIILAYFVYNIAHPKKINWLMSLVDDDIRGKFTANKEIVSLVSGMIFSFLMSAVVDHYTEIGKIKTAFIISAVVFLILGILHTMSLVLTPESNCPTVHSKKIWQNIKDVFGNANIIKVTVVFILYYISTYIATPFYGTYTITELGFSLKFVSILTMLSSAARIAVSRFWGSYADKNSFAKMIEKCLLFLAVAYIGATFAIPSNGKIMFSVYYICHGIALGGINSALINLIFDYVPNEKRADSLAVSQAFAGLTGFVSTLLVSPLVSYIQANGNKIFGIKMFAQQFLSFFSLIIVVATIIYIRKSFIKKKM